MRRLYFDIDKENNKVILDRKDFDYLMSIGHYNDKAIEIIETLKNDNSSYYDETIINNTIRDLLDILKGSDNDDNNSNSN